MEELNKAQVNDLHAMEDAMKQSQDMLRDMWNTIVQQCDNLHQASVVCAHAICNVMLTDIFNKVGATGDVEGLTNALSKQMVGTPWVLALLMVATDGGITPEAKSKCKLDTVAEAVDIVEQELSDV